MLRRWVWLTKEAVDALSRFEPQTLEMLAVEAERLLGQQTEIAEQDMVLQNELLQYVSALEDLLRATSCNLSMLRRIGTGESERIWGH